MNNEDNIIDITKPRQGRAALLEMGWEEALLEHVKQFNQLHSLVIIGGKTRVMRKTNIFNREGYEFLIPGELNALYAGTSIQTGLRSDKYGEEKAPVYANHFKAWYTHQQSDVYRSGVVFKPNADVPEGYFNTWQGYSVTPKKTCDYPKIKAHIEGIVCQHNQELIDYFYSWVAHSFQHPEIPGGAALVLRGKKGSGKGRIGDFLQKIWGWHGMYISQSDQIVGKFNAHLADVCFVFADEAFFSGDKKHESTLKALVTNSLMIIERKGLDAYQETNYLKIFMATNEDFAVPASADERRWGVYDVSDSMINNTKYFDELTEEINSEEVAASFLADMLDYDIAGWRPNQIPESTGLKHQRLASLITPGKWLADVFEHGSFDGYEWNETVEFLDLKKSYLDWCASHKISGWEIVTDKSLSVYLSDIYQKIHMPSTRRRAFVFGKFDKAIADFCKKESIEL